MNNNYIIVLHTADSRKHFLRGINYFSYKGFKKFEKFVHGLEKKPFFNTFYKLRTALKNVKSTELYFTLHCITVLL